MYIPKKILHFGIKSCEAKLRIHMEYAWFMGGLHNKKQVLGIHTSCFSVLSKTMFNQAEILLGQNYAIGLEKYYSSHKLSSLLNKSETSTVCIMYSNREGLLTDSMRKKLIKGKVEISFTRKL
jgi:hypothetical protein